jgi:serine/threonine-protein kinase
MELVDGQPLSEILERYRRLDPYVVLDIVAQAARALDTAHQAGIVHRDIKPGNLLIMSDGTTKITDFGIAKANSLQAVNLTATGIVMGTALYVSPEQATGSPLNGSSDIYSLGVVAYECLAGDPPFIADQPLAIAIMHKHDPVPALPPDVPRPVADLVYAMLAKTPDGRPESALHVADRAEVIRDARSGGFAGPLTADLPVVPNFPTTAQSANFYQNDAERVRDSRRPGTRGFLFGGIAVATCGVIAIVAILLTSSNAQTAKLTIKQGPSGTSASQDGAPATASVPGSSAGQTATGTNLGTASLTAAPSSSKSPSPTPTRRGSPTPTHGSPPTSASPSAPASSTTATSPSTTTSTSSSATATATTSSPAPTTPPPDTATATPDPLGA